jgi:hypothetical protein
MTNEFTTSELPIAAPAKCQERGDPSTDHTKFLYAKEIIGNFTIAKIQITIL